MCPSRYQALGAIAPPHFARVDRIATPSKPGKELAELAAFRSGAAMPLLSSLIGRREEPAPAVTLAVLEQLLTDIRGERSTLEAVLSTASNTDLSSVRSALDQVEQHAELLARQLDALGTAAARLAETARSADALERRFAELDQRSRDIERMNEESLQRTEQVAREREALQEAIAHAQVATDSLEALRGDAGIARLAEELPTIAGECIRIREQHSTLLTEANLLTTKAATAMQEATGAASVSADAAARVSGAAQQIEELQRKVDRLAGVDVLSRDMTAQLQTLNGLAKHVSTKVKELEGQSQTIDRALVDARRVGEMLWEMEGQVGKMNDGAGLAARVGEDLGQVDGLHKEVAAKLEEATHNRDEFAAKADAQQREALEAVQAVQSHLDSLSVRRQEMDTLAERLRFVQTGLADAVARLSTVSAAESTMGVLTEKVESVAAQVAQMTAQMHALEEKQAAVTAFEQRLDMADRAVRQTASQIDLLGQRQKDLEALKAAFDTVDHTYAAVRKLVDELRQQKQDFAGFVRHATEFMQQAPQINTRIDDLAAGVAEAKAQADGVLALGPGVDDIAGRLANLTPQLQVIDDLQGRLSALHELSSEIDRRMAAQLARHADVEQLRVACDGLSTQAAEIHHRLAALEHTQGRLSPLTGQVVEFESQLSAARANLASLQRDEESIAAQERRLAGLGEAAVALGAEIATRIETVGALQAELATAGSVKDKLYDDFAQLQALQRAASSAAGQCEEQMEQIADRARQIEDHRVRLATIERAIATLGSRHIELDQLANSVDAKVGALAERDRIVDAVRQELDTIHEVSKKTQADLAAIAARRAEIAEGRADMERLAAALADTGQKIAEVERRGSAVDEVHRKADAVAHLLQDVRITLDTIGEQKAMIDYVSEMLSKVDDVISEARGTMKALQAERKLAQRIAENVRSIHARAGAEIRQVG